MAQHRRSVIILSLSVIIAKAEESGEPKRPLLALAPAHLSFLSRVRRSMDAEAGGRRKTDTAALLCCACIIIEEPRLCIYAGLYCTYYHEVCNQHPNDPTLHWSCFDTMQTTSLQCLAMIIIKHLSNQPGQPKEYDVEDLPPAQQGGREGAGFSLSLPRGVQPPTSDVAHCSQLAHPQLGLEGWSPLPSNEYQIIGNCCWQSLFIRAKLLFFRHTDPAKSGDESTHRR